MNGSYPRWICEPCGLVFGTKTKRIATYHQPNVLDEKDKCGWCGSYSIPLTEPRDFGYPKEPKKMPP